MDALPDSAIGHAPVPEYARGDAGNFAVTIGIPCYNRPALLAEALASVAAQQDFTDFEVVVCDDGALPETRAVVVASGVRSIRYYVHRPALGPVRNWNRCIELARGKWVSVLHEDDCVYPWFLRTVAPHLVPGIAAVAVKCVQGAVLADVTAPTQPATGRRYAPIWFLHAAPTPFPGVVFDRATALRLGGFNPAEEGLADYAFWYALAGAGGILALRDVAAFYRVNEGQWTERAWPTMLRRAHLLRLRIAREQLPARRRLGRWLARFYTGRMARAYARRFTGRPAVLTRAQRFRRMAFAWLPSGWVWAALQRLR